MAIKLIGNYAKRLGLPGYSSHQYSISVETEISDARDIQGEASRIYDLLQNAVDSEIKQTGFVPGETYGSTEIDSTAQSGNGSHQPSRNTNLNGNGEVRWSCSEKQKELILKLIDENNLNRGFVEETSFERFGVGVKQLNKLQASGLITELLDVCGKQQRSQNPRNQ